MITGKKAVIIGFAFLISLAGAVFVCKKQNGDSWQSASNKTAIANPAATDAAKNDLSASTTAPSLPENATVQDYVAYFKKTGADLNNSDNDLLISRDKINTDFFKELDKKCPYYEPDGASYRDCLDKLVATQDKSIDAIFADINSDVKIILAEYKAADKETSHPTLKQMADMEYSGTSADFLEQMAELKRTWRPYRDALCRAEYSINGFGSDYTGMVATCMLYETDKTSRKVLSLRYDWIGSQVADYINNANLQPKTEAFKALIEKEKTILSGN